MASFHYPSCRSMVLAILFTSILFSYHSAWAQPESDQDWNLNVALVSDSIVVDCPEFILPIDVGRILSEPDTTNVEGEFSKTLRAAFPNKITLQPESGTSDTLSNISGCFIDGADFFLQTNDIGDTITITETGNIDVPGGTFALDDPDDVVHIVLRGTTYYFVGGGAAGGGGGGHGDGANCAIGQYPLGVDAQGAVQSCSVDQTGGTVSLNQAYINGDTITGVDDFATAVRIEDTVTTTSLNFYMSGGVPIIESVCAGANCDVELAPKAGRSTIITSPDIVGSTVWNPNGSTTLTGSHIRRRSVFLPASNAEMDGSLCTDPQRIPIGVNVLRLVNCADNDSATLLFNIIMPDAYNGGSLTVEMQALSTNPTPSGNYQIGWSMRCVAPGTDIGASVGGEQTTLVSFSGQNNLEFETSSPITPLGSCSGGAGLVISGQIGAAATTSNDINASYVYGIKLEYEVTSLTD